MCYIADVVEHFLSNEETKLDNNEHEEFECFFDAKEELFHSHIAVNKAFYALDTSIADLLNILDDFVSRKSDHYANNALIWDTSDYYYGTNTYGFVPISLLGLNEIINTLAYY